MKERPILFSGPMVRALLEGRKTQTRRIVKLPRKHSWSADYDGQIIFDDGSTFGSEFSVDELRCPRGEPDDRLWVREAHYLTDDGDAERVVYAADTNSVLEHFAAVDSLPAPFSEALKAKHKKLRPSIFIPRWASRILLEITEVRVDRLQDISEEDAKAEGIQNLSTHDHIDFGIPGIVNAQHPCRAYQLLWESINGAGSWDANPYVWVISFKRIKP